MTHNEKVECIKNHIKFPLTPVVLYFYSETCVPCKKTSGIIDNIKTKYDGSINVFKINVADEPEFVREQSVRAVPTVKIFDNGSEVASKTGFQSQDIYETIIEELII